MMLLRLRELPLATGARHGQARAEPGGVAAAQAAGVEPQAAAERLAFSAAAVSHRDGHAPVRVARLDHHGALDRRPAQAEIDAVVPREPELPRCLRGHL